jgi:hypothetical protein
VPNSNVSRHFINKNESLWACFSSINYESVALYCRNLGGNMIVEERRDSVQNKKIDQQKALVITMYRFLETLQSKPFNRKDLEQFYTIDAEMIINNELAAKGIDEFFKHFKLMAAKPCNYILVFAESPIITENNRLAIQYKIEMYGQQQVTMYSMVFFTFINGKICKWDQVVSTISATEMQLTHQ